MKRRELSGRWYCYWS